MQTETLNAGQKLDAKVRQYSAEHHCDYAEALGAMKKLEPDLWYSYAADESDPDREVRRGAEEFGRRVVAYQEEWNLSRDEAARRVRAHDPKMKVYSNEAGGVNMNTEKIPLSAESVVDARAREYQAKHNVKDYGAAVKAVLDADEHLKTCYAAGRPYIEGARQYQEDPMRSREIQALVEPRPEAILTPAPERPAPEFTNTARLRLGALLAGAKAADSGIDVQLAVQIANLVPDEVRAAAGEALDELTRAMINRRGMRGATSQAYSEAYRLAVAEHPELWAASQTGTLTEEGLKDLFIQWFK